MKECKVVVVDGQIQLPPEIRLPDGLQARLVWEEDEISASVPYEREMLTEEDVQEEIEWARTHRSFSGDHR